MAGTLKGGAALQVGDTTLFVRRIGYGPALLTMHGGLGLDHTSLSALDDLGAMCELIYYDHRGNGRSARGPLDAVDLGTWAEDADRLRALLGHDRIILFGHSYGGYVALEYALRHPERVGGLILCSTAPVVDYMDVIGANVMRRGANPEQLSVLQRAFTVGATDDADFHHAWRTLLPLYFHAPDRVVMESMDRATVYSAAGFNRSAQCLATYDVRPSLGSIRVPTLVLVGDDDFAAPRAQGAERLVAGIPGAQLVVLERCGHFPFIEQRSQTLAVMERFIASLASPMGARA